MLSLRLACDSKGNLAPADLAQVAQAAEGKRRVLLLTHGWQTDFPEAQAWFDDMLARLTSRLADDVLIVCIHWPSDIIDPGSPLNLLAEVTYWQMENRAARIGSNGVCKIIETILIHGTPAIECVGHSFGCIVMSEALAALAGNNLGSGISFTLTLIQAAMPFDALEQNREYGLIQYLYPKLKITRSDSDDALGCAFPVGEGLEGKFKPAMGCKGPSAGTMAQYRDLVTVLDLSPQFATHTGAPFLPETLDLIAQ